ncbi:MAG: hydroxymethylpyrimidine/phosphomethylpyrimidine kinase [Flavobacteriales bacterium]|jgi:hydroxymethylpyrimidine/phosphomethylpyrimidine kinase
MTNVKFSPSANPPVVLTLSCLDPSGSGGIQADIETAASTGTHCAPLISSLATTGECPEREIVPIDANLLIEQASSILKEMDVKAIKLGFLASVDNIEAIHALLTNVPEIPVVSHPVFSLWDSDLAPLNEYTDAFAKMILPMSQVSILTAYEARLLAKEADTLQAVAHEILSYDCGSVLITGTGEKTQESRNSFYQEKEGVKHFEGLQESVESQGFCTTLAMSTASYIAHGFSLLQAIEEAQHFTWQASRASRQLGFGRPSLHRLYWADSNIDITDKPVSKSCH